MPLISDKIKIFGCESLEGDFLKVYPFTRPDFSDPGSKEGGGDDFDDFFDLGGEEEQTLPPKPKAEKPAQDAGPSKTKGQEDDFLASPADFMEEVANVNVEEPQAPKAQAVPPKETAATDDEVFGGLEGFEEFLSIGDEAKSKPAREEPKPKPADKHKEAQDLGPKPIPQAPKESAPPKEFVHASPKDVGGPQATPGPSRASSKDMIDDAFEELFAEPPKQESAKKPIAQQQKPKPAQTPSPKPERPQPEAKPAPAKKPPKTDSMDTVSDEAFEALFHEDKDAAKDGRSVQGDGALGEGLGIEAPRRKRGIKAKLVLFILIPLLLLGAFTYFSVFTKKGLLGLSFYSYFIEGYKKPKPEVLKMLGQKFEDIKSNRLKKDYFPDYVYAVKELRNIISSDSRYPKAHAYLVYALLFSSGDPLNQTTKKSVETLLEESDKLNPSLSEGVLARAMYDFRSGNLAEAERSLKRLLSSNPKEPIAYEILGNISFSRSDYRGAEKNFRESVNLDPQNIRATHSLAMALYSGGDTDGALEYLEKLRAEPVNHIPSEIDRNYINWKKGKTAEAKANFQRIFEKSQDNISGFNYARLAMYLSDILYEEKRYDEAVSYLDKGLKKEPFNYSIAYRLGVIYLDRDDAEKSVPLLKKAVDLAPKESAFFVAYAKALRKSKKTDDALAQVGKALELEPANMEALYERGLCYRASGKLDEALASFESVLQSDARNVLALLEVGEIKNEKKQFEDAMEKFKTAIAFDRNSARAHGGLGISYVGLSNRKEALAQFAIAERLSPDNTDIILNKAKSFLAMGNLEEAGKNFERVARLDPQNAEAQTGLGDILFERRGYDDAVRAYRKALEISPKDVDLKVKLAKALIEIKQYRPALEQLVEGSKMAIDYFPIHLQTGIAYRNIGSMDEALRELEKSTVLMPDSADARYEYGITLMQNVQVAQGLAQVLRAVEINPSHLRALEELVNFYFESGDMSKAVDFSQKILKVDPKNSKARLKLAECYRRMGKNKEAYNTYIQIINQDKYNAQAYLGAGKVLEDTQQYASALKLYSAAARVNPKNPQTHYHLGYVYKYMEQNDKAIESFRTFLKLNPDSLEAPSVKEEVDFLNRLRARQR